MDIEAGISIKSSSSSSSSGSGSGSGSSGNTSSHGSNSRSSASKVFPHEEEMERLTKSGDVQENAEPSGCKNER